MGFHPVFPQLRRSQHLFAHSVFAICVHLRHLRMIMLSVAWCAMSMASSTCGHGESIVFAGHVHPQTTQMEDEHLYFR